MNLDANGRDLFTNSKKALVCITYNSIPDFNNIFRALEIVDYAIIVDNGSEKPIVDELKKYCAGSEKIFLIENSENLGISRAYNKAVEFSKTLEIQWLFFFDSDANYSNSYFTEMMVCWMENSSKGLKVGIVSPIVCDDSGLLGIQWKTGSSLVSSVITSGIMTNVEVYEEVGGYDEDYFLELADFAFSKRMIEHGYLIIRVNKILISQTFGLSLNSSFALLKVFDLISSISSRSKLRRNKSNVFRTRYPIYGEERLNQYYKNYTKLTGDRRIHEFQSRIYIFILKKINDYIRRKIY